MEKLKTLAKAIARDMARRDDALHQGKKIGARDAEEMSLREGRVADRILAGLEESMAIAQGKKKPVRVHRVVVTARR